VSLIPQVLPKQGWAKVHHDPETGRIVSWHSLPAHSADVAACLGALLAVPGIRDRLAALAGQEDLPAWWGPRLAALAFLHDMGKACADFQAQWVFGDGRRGHARPARRLLETTDPVLQQKTADALPLEDLLLWGEAAVVRGLYAVFSHHGGLPPAAESTNEISRIWRTTADHDPFAILAALTRRLRAWIPDAFQDGGPPLPETPAFWHGFAGLVMLADWIGSDETLFPHGNGADEDRFAIACDRAAQAVKTIGLDPAAARRAVRAGLETPPPFAALSPYRPLPSQEALAHAPGRIVLLEADTGSGKTEGALWRFLTLFQAGRVDGLYFALPTRVAATAMFDRVRAAVARMIPDDDARPAVVLAVPGYLRTDGAHGRALPAFQVQWDDGPGAAHRDRWAAEHPKRFLAATIAVGTIDQALMGAIPVRHAQMRAACLSRSLLVVDEVHASDAYMERLLLALLTIHRAADGEAVLLSATLGSATRARLLSGRRRTRGPSLSEAERVPYPAVSSETDPTPRQTETRGWDKAVVMEPVALIDEPTAIARRALDAARAGAKVLVIRNTVKDAVAVTRALHALAPDDPVLFRCAGVPTVHHGRFSREDRIHLDRAVETAVGRDRPPGGCVVPGTQTLEQSLDIDADLIFTDLCPVDTLLQRLGRLHRHERARPSGFETPRAVILTPDAPEVLVSDRPGHGLGGVKTPYPAVPVLAATWDLITQNPVWRLPAMNRLLVERGTHPDALAALCARYDGAAAATASAATKTRTPGAWAQTLESMEGRNRAESTQGTLTAVDWAVPLEEMKQVDDPPPTTRLGLRDRHASLDPPPMGPFGRPVAALSLSAHLIPDGAAEDVEIVDIHPLAEGFSFKAANTSFRYDRYGIQKID